MTTEINEKEFIEMYSKEQYISIAEQALKTTMEKSNFTKNRTACCSIMAFDLKEKSGEKMTLIVECTAKKIAEDIIDFGIVKMLLSDEEMPDIALDRINDFKRSKEKFDQENKE